VNNTIKRTTKNFIDVEWLIDTSNTKKGETSHLTRHPYWSGWEDVSRNTFVFTSMIRNEKICRILAQG